MTTVITRLFKDEASARDAAKKIMDRGVPRRACSVIASQEGEGAKDLKARLTSAKVNEAAVDPYAKHIDKGLAAVVVRATYIPLTAATIVRGMMAGFDTVGAGDVVDDYYMPDGPERTPSILLEHPRFLTVSPKRTEYEGGPITSGFGMRLLSVRRKRKSAISGGGFKSRAFWPMPLLSTKSRKRSVISGGRHMSKSFWPMPLLSASKRSNSVIKGGDLPFSRALGWPAVS
ncbi:hypothetical protein ROLI_021930 [Roseobacter fucihabitans]|uniref:Uncharacterized protein n=1 Tax=Roseobacter fucihabitans TaxID=1537242 RepID=A0ABZ2BVB7_9RHOB|nr:hypothetical protein [Roseobacter litoralis]MBC6966778.1 hypothetical protein [Roseobacter litoralis]